MQHNRHVKLHTTELPIPRLERNIQNLDTQTIGKISKNVHAITYSMSYRSAHLDPL